MHRIARSETGVHTSFSIGTKLFKMERTMLMVHLLSRNVLSHRTTPSCIDMRRGAKQGHIGISHYSSQTCDGLRGTIVIYDPQDPYRHLYDVDDGEWIA